VKLANGFLFVLDRNYERQHLVFHGSEPQDGN
jgi:hypothetical protein